MTSARPLPKLMVAPNGARRGKSDHPAVPITLEETVGTAIACRKTGADGLHLHVRDKDGNHSLDTGLYREALNALEQAVPDLFLQVTSEAAGRYPAKCQHAMIRELRPRSVSVALREMIREPSDEREARDLYAWARDHEVLIHHITYTPHELARLLDCVERGVIPGTHHQLQLVLGTYDGREPSQPGDLAEYLALLKSREGELVFDWMLCAFGSAETACLVHAIQQGGKARVGFENSFWNADGSVARDNAERVAEVRAALAQTWSPADR